VLELSCVSNGVQHLSIFLLSLLYFIASASAYAFIIAQESEIRVNLLQKLCQNPNHPLHLFLISLRIIEIMIKRFFPLIYLGLIAAVLMVAALNRKQAPEISELGQPVSMAIPADYREIFSLYLVVDRPDATVRHIYASPVTIAVLNAGETIPYGTQIVIEAYHAKRDVFGNILRDENGHYIAEEMFPQIHMMEKREDWTVEDLPSPVGVIDWNFASFNTDSYLPSTENRNDCLTCHDASAFRRDFLFSRLYLENYAETGEPQYLYCNLPERANCIR
jgi:hypothetical protein